MADVPNVPAGNEERPIIGGGAADRTGEEERGRGRRGRGVTATPGKYHIKNLRVFSF